MATPLAHAFFALAGCKAVIHRKMPPRFWVLVAICGIIPDIDVFWRRLVASRTDIWSHRGISHSLLWAVAFGLLAACIYELLGRGKTSRQADPPTLPTDPAALHDSSEVAGGAAKGRFAPLGFLVMWLIFALATISHSLLDMLSSGYRGVMLLAPFSNDIHEFDWRPIWAAPAWLRDWFVQGGLRGRGRGSWLYFAVASEFIVVWLPMIGAIVVSSVIRRLRTRLSSATSGPPDGR